MNGKMLGCLAMFATFAWSVCGYTAPSVVFDTPAADENGSMVLGDGEIGSLAWVDASGCLHTVLQRTDSWDEVGRHIKVGRIDYETGRAVDEGSYRQELSLDRGEFAITWKSAGQPVSLRYRIQWGAAPLAVCEVTGAPQTVAKDVVWRTYPGGSKLVPAKNLEINFKYSGPTRPNDELKLAIVADQILSGLPAGLTGWCHENANATADKLYAFLDETQGTGDLGKQRLLQDRSFGAITRREQDAAGNVLFLSAVTCFHPCANAAEWRQRTLDVLAREGWTLANASAKRAEHLAGWRSFWDLSHVEISPSAVATDRTFEFPCNAKLPIAFGADPHGSEKFNGTCKALRLEMDGREVFAGVPKVGAALVPAGEGKGPKHALHLDCTLTFREVDSNQRILDNITPGTSDGFLVDLLGRKVRVILGHRAFNFPKPLVAGREARVEVDVTPMGRVHVAVNGETRELSAEVTTIAEECRRVNLAWAAQRYTTRCAAKGNMPLRFNGSIFTLSINGDPDARRWGHGYWWQNTRLPYYPMFAAGDLDLLQPLFKQYAVDMLPFNVRRTRLYLGHGGAYYPECLQPWGDHFIGCYGTQPFKTRKDRLQDSGFHKYEWVGQLELSLMLLDYYAYTQDADWFRRVARPAVREYVRYFDEHYKVGADGRYDWQPAQAVETWWDCTAPMPEVAGLTCIVQRCLALPDGLFDADERKLFEKIRTRIPDLPTRKLKDGRTAYAPGARFEHHGNIEHPELYCVFPFRLCSFEKPNAPIAKAAYESRWTRLYRGWSQEELFATYLGMTEEARSHFVNRVLTNVQSQYRWPAMWGPNFDWTPDQCAGGNIQNILQSMALQVEGRKIFLTPAWPKDWNGSFKLHAPYRTTLEGRIENGQVKDLVVDPPARAKDVVVVKK